ncbi:bifunctional oligoribonuclease/PAP phosphatase NrnA [Ureaplasma miroungigenitalium]|uniref:Bifunctional oligoribonuclease/PAP phosphatase NrnA n=1 Tax=Ureaplasma miroungigenitalium TaxID=1042321 RepID=A0ABT3BN80_9BACT|nr:bifunctional oligoribonuclease/PAP phosphatase NrnA [Ureaplasma miroungigenitalium]MCV3728602.1 bifunctional oligoribonuclease/PAP phosphatase NrnA [Ureaplasma miroungigenitalium]MCV3734391.1 bifunctional oligoribonuclease/PAP phosphatase NrnA [Ureaplasma miroungigenitalium]
MININYLTAAEEWIKHTQGFSKASIFVHKNPDCDALGSAFALARILRLNAFWLDVKIVGMNTLDEKDFKNLFELTDEEVGLDFIKESVGFIVDTANSERVLSNLHTFCKKTILIDHHVKNPTYTDFMYIDDTSIAACEMIGLALKNSSLNYDLKTLEYLFIGLCTDSNRLMYDKVDDDTYNLMGWFYKNGVKHQKIYNQLYARNFQEALFDAQLMTKMVIDENVGYLLVQPEWNEIYNFDRWGEKVNLLASVREAKIWFVIYYVPEDQHYKISLRSADYPIRLVANEYNGGGHDLAAGCYLDSLDQLPNFIQNLKNFIINIDAKKE